MTKRDAKTDLDTREILADTFSTAAVILGANRHSFTKPEPKMLSRHWTVFQVPSATTSNYLHYVVGSVKDGFRCSCVGYQSSGNCYHARTVTRALGEVRQERRNGKEPPTSSRSRRAGGRR